jgi:hypothetical protein
MARYRDSFTFLDSLYKKKPQRPKGKRSLKISEMVEGFYFVISTIGLNTPNTGGAGERGDDDDNNDEMHTYVYYMLIFLYSYL